eukprot:1172096-Prorocentrum_minimum.AAC.1
MWNTQPVPNVDAPSFACFAPRPAGSSWRGARSRSATTTSPGPPSGPSTWCSGQLPPRGPPTPPPARSCTAHSSSAGTQTSSRCAAAADCVVVCVAVAVFLCLYLSLSLSSRHSPPFVLLSPG